VARERGDLVLHGLPSAGWALDGEEAAPGAFRVARIRWTWDLQRPRYRSAAFSGPAPDIGEHQSGAALTGALPPNEAADVDIVVSYGKPHWPNASGSFRDDARLGPLGNQAGMWLMATSYRRSQMTHPAPEQVGVPRPGARDVANRILCGGPDEVASTCWFVESVTTRRAVQNAITGGAGSPG
jgi:hypothetical protein